MALDRTLADPTPLTSTTPTTTAAPSSGAPSLGYGNQNSVDLNTVNSWMRTQPWYQNYLKSQGIDPNNVHLNDGQKQQIVKLAQANGVVVDEGHNGQQVDDSGNFQAKSNLGRNILIGAGVAGLALTGLGAAGIGPLSGLLAGGEAAGAGGAAAAEGAGAASAGAAGATAAGEGGLLASTALPATGALATGATSSLAGAGAAAGAGGAFDAAGNFIGDSSIPGATGSFDAASGGPGVGSILKTAASVGGALGAAGSGAAGARLTEAQLQQRQDQLAQQGYLDQLQGANTDLNQKKFALTAPATRASTSVKGDILANAKDFSYGAPTMVGDIPVPSSSGGLRPSILSDNSRALGRTISAQQLANQQAGDQFAPLPTPPTLTPLPQPGATSNILNTAGTIGNFAQLLAKYNNQYGASS